MAHDERPQDDETPHAHHSTARHGGERFGDPARRDGGGGHDGERRGGEGGQPATDGDELELAKATLLLPPLEVAPRCQVAEGRDRECDQVGRDAPEWGPQGEEEHEPGECGRNADAGETAGIGGELFQVVALDVAAGESRAAGGELLADPPHAPQVADGGGEHVDAGVRIVHPVDGDLVDAQAVSLGDHEELGVEEPALVLDERQQDGHEVAPDGLEPALGVAEASPHERSQQAVVDPRDHFAAGAAHDARAA